MASERAASAKFANDDAIARGVGRDFIDTI